MNDLAEELLNNGTNTDCPIIDMHGHWGAFSGIYLPASDRNIAYSLLKRSNIRLLLFCHHASLFIPEIGNKSNIDEVRNHPKNLKAYCGLNPNYPDIIKNDVKNYDKYPDVFAGFKILADYHGLPVTNVSYTPAWEYADSFSLPILIHTWNGSEYSNPLLIEECANKYPNVRILLGHCFHDDWVSASRIANEYPNAYAELTAVSDEIGGIEYLLENVGSKKIIFGTDFPWFSYPYYIGALIGSGANENELRDILYRNACKILKMTDINVK